MDNKKKIENSKRWRLRNKTKSKAETTKRTKTVRTLHPRNPTAARLATIKTDGNTSVKVDYSF